MKILTRRFPTRVRARGYDGKVEEGKSAGKLREGGGDVQAPTQIDRRFILAGLPAALTFPYPTHLGHLSSCRRSQINKTERRRIEQI